MKQILKIFFIIVMCVIMRVFVYAGEWVKDGDGWMYKKDDGIFCEGEQKIINGKWYYFGEDKFLLTGLQKIGKYYYSFNEDGTPNTNDLHGGGRVFKVNDKGRIVEITEEEFYALDENEFASNSSNAKEQLEPVLNDAKMYLKIAPLSYRALSECLRTGAYTDDKVDWAIYNVGIDSKQQAILCAKEYLKIRDNLNYSVDREQLKDILSGVFVYKDFNAGEGFSIQDAKYGVEIAYNETKAVDTNENAVNYELLLLSDKYIHDMIYQALKIDLNEYDIKPLEKNLTVKDKAKKLASFLRIACPYYNSDDINEVLRLLGFANSEIVGVIPKFNVEGNASAARMVKYLFINGGQDLTKEQIIGKLSLYGFMNSEILYVKDKYNEIIIDSNIVVYDENMFIAELTKIGFNRKRAKELYNEFRVTFQSSEPLQTQVNSNVISNNTVTNDDNQMKFSSSKQKVYEKLIEHIGEKPWSKKKLALELEIVDGYKLEDIEYVISKAGVNWIEQAQKMIVIIMKDNKNVDYIKYKLIEAGFTDLEIEKSLELNNLIKAVHP